MKPEATALQFASEMLRHHARLLEREQAHDAARDLVQLATWLDGEIERLHPGPWLLVRVTTETETGASSVEVLDRGGFARCAAGFAARTSGTVVNGILERDLLRRRVVRLALVLEEELDRVIHGATEPIGDA